MHRLTPPCAAVYCRRHCIDPQERRRIERLELFDEFEEWHLIQVGMLRVLCLLWVLWCVDSVFARESTPESVRAVPAGLGLESSSGAACLPPFSPPLIFTHSFFFFSFWQACL